MTLVNVTHKGDKKGVKMTECPCGYELSDSMQLEAHLLRDHTPEDFGLTPIGEKSPYADGPLFEKI